MVFPLIPLALGAAAGRSSMGKKSQPSPPPAADPNQIIGAQAQANRIDQFTPFGNLTYSGPFRNQATLELAPGLEEILSQQIRNDMAIGRLSGQALGPGGISGLIGNPLSLEGLPDFSGLPGLSSNAGDVRGDVERSFFDRSANLLNEQFGLDEERLRQRLANQGLQAGGEAFGSELGLFNQRRGETFENLARDAVLFGGQESSRELQNQLALNQQAFSNVSGLRGQLLGEQQGLRANQFNELASLLGLQQVAQPTLQNFFGPGQVNALDPFALQQQGLQNIFNTQSQQAGSAKGSGAGLLGTVLGSILSR